MRYRITTDDGPIELLDDSYNAAPQSVAALLDVMGRRAANRKVFIFGDMLELAGESVRYHEEVASLVHDAGVDVLITVGAMARLASSEGVETANYTDAEAAAAAISSLLKPGDLIAVKASRRLGLEKVVASIKAMGSNAPALSWKIEDEAVSARPSAR
jgi:UDP-N-acetylmuramyl pentapeptide synthase